MKAKISILFIFLLFSCNKQTSFINQNTLKSSLKLTDNQIVRLNSYIDSNYYSEQLKRKVPFSPLMFAVTEDGHDSVILSCTERSYECTPGIRYFQTLKKYETKINKKFFIIAIENKLKWNNRTISLKNRQDIDNLISTKTIIKTKKNNNERFFDEFITPIDTESCVVNC